MNRSFLLALIGIFLLQAPHAHALVRIGIKGGVNFANVSTTQDSVDFERTPGFTIGAAGEVAVAPALAVRGELLFVQKGAKFTSPTGDGRVRLDELVFAPFLVVRYPLPNLIPFLQAGPELSVNTLAKSKDGGPERSIGHLWRDNNFGLNVGGGVIIPLGPNDITFDVRYNIGLLNLRYTGDYETRTNGVQLFAGYNFFKI